MKNMPLPLGDSRPICRYSVLTITVRGKYAIDKRGIGGINRLTNRYFIMEDTVDNEQQQQQQAPEDRSACRGRDAEPFTRKGQRSEVPGRRVFRSSGHCAGQVRNVAEGLVGECVGNRRCQRVWGIKTNILSGPSKFGKSGHCRTSAEKAGSSSASKNPRRCPGVYREQDCSRRADSSAAAIYFDSTKVQTQDSPTNDRAGVSRKKNAAMKCATSRAAVPAVHIAVQYERLRAAAQGLALPPEARSGLSLFLRRGMWGSAQAMTSDFKLPAHSSPSAPPAQHTVLVQIFASMALNSNRRRTR